MLERTRTVKGAEPSGVQVNSTNSSRFTSSRNGAPVDVKVRFAKLGRLIRHCRESLLIHTKILDYITNITRTADIMSKRLWK